MDVFLVGHAIRPVYVRKECRITGIRAGQANASGFVHLRPLDAIPRNLKSQKGGE